MDAAILDDGLPELALRVDHGERRAAFRVPPCRLAVFVELDALKEAGDSAHDRSLGRRASAARDRAYYVHNAKAVRRFGGVEKRVKVRGNTGADARI